MFGLNTPRFPFEFPGIEIDPPSETADTSVVIRSGDPLSHFSDIGFVVEIGSGGGGGVDMTTLADPRDASFGI